MTEKRKRGQYGSRDPWLDLTILLAGCSKMTGIPICRVLDCSYNTANARLNKPENFTLGELKKLCKAYGIEKDALFSTLKIGV